MSTIFEMQVQVQPEHLNELGQLSSVQSQIWMQEIAVAHAEQLGMGLAQYQQLKHAMVPVEQHVQYRKPCFLGDKLLLRSWLSDLNAMHSYRQYAFYRAKDQSIVLLAQTQWACVELATGRSKRLSPSFSQAFQSIAQDLNPMNFSIL